MTWKRESRGAANPPAKDTVNNSPIRHTDPREFRQAQIRHLIECGPRVVAEAIDAVWRGRHPDNVLDEFCRISPQGYHSTLYYYAALGDGGGS